MHIILFTKHCAYSKVMLVKYFGTIIIVDTAKSVFKCAFLPFPPLHEAVMCILSIFLSAENDVRLVDGPNPYEGRLEVFKGGVWLSVCNSYGSRQFGSVVCKQLSYPG